jgi:hypothetical protein
MEIKRGCRLTASFFISIFNCISYAKVNLSQDI